MSHSHGLLLLDSDKEKIGLKQKFNRWLEKHENAQRIWEGLARTIRYAFWLGIGSLALWFLYSVLASLFKLQLLNPQEVISLWVAEVPLAVLFRYIFGESIPDRPDLRIRRHEVSSNRCYSAAVSNRGRSTAEQCRARVSLSDWHDNNLKNDNGQIMKKGFHRTLTCKLKWPSEPTEIRPDDEEVLIDMFRIVTKDNIEYMEFPQETGWDRLAASLELTKSTYNGFIIVGARNARPAVARFTVSKATGSLVFQFF